MRHAPSFLTKVMPFEGYDGLPQKKQVSILKIVSTKSREA